MIRSFSGSIYNGKITISEADKKQNNLLENTLQVNNKVRPRSKEKKKCF